MNETYVECLVKRKSSLALKFLKILTIMLAACFLFLWMMGMSILVMVIAVVFAGLAYFLSLYGEIEYEYLYIDKELCVDRIMNRSRRKRIMSFDLGRMEIIAPLRSHYLDSYQNRTAKITDYSSRQERQPEARYAMFYDGKQKIILEPSPELLKAIQTIAPRKVFRD